MVILSKSLGRVLLKTLYCSKINLLILLAVERTFVKIIEKFFKDVLAFKKFDIAIKNTDKRFFRVLLKTLGCIIMNNIVRRFCKDKKVFSILLKLLINYVDKVPSL